MCQTYINWLPLRTCPNRGWSLGLSNPQAHTLPTESDWLGPGYLLMCFVCPPSMFFAEIFCHVFPSFLTGKFVFIIVEFCEFLYILDKKPVSEVCFANIFFKFVALSFHPYNRFFHRAKVFNFDEIQLSDLKKNGSCFWRHV